jgi:hypothetical protein
LKDIVSFFIFFFFFTQKAQLSVRLSELRASGEEEVEEGQHFVGVNFSLTDIVADIFSSERERKKERSF